MITMRVGTVDDIEFDLMQKPETSRIPLPIIDPLAEVYFYAKQTDPAPLQTDPDPPKEINIKCNVIDPVGGIVIAPFTAADTDTAGKYKCHIKVEMDSKITFCKYPFEMVIWEEE